MIMSAQQPSPAEAFAIERLRENPDLDYATLRHQAAEAGLTMQPILYGRARRHLGLPPLSERKPPQQVQQQNQPAAHEPPSLAESPEPEVEARTAPVASARSAGSPKAAAPNATSRKGSPGFEFVVDRLRQEPAIVYADLKAEAAAHGFAIAPIMFGRAKALLGLVPVKARGDGKVARTKAAAKAAAVPTNEPAIPRQLKQVESVAADRFGKQLADARSLDQLVAVVRDLDAERRRLRTLLERVVDLIDEALG